MMGIAAILALLGIVGGPIGLATAALQFGTEVVKVTPAVVKDVRAIEAAKRQRVAYLHVDHRTAIQQRRYGPMRWVQ